MFRPMALVLILSLSTLSCTLLSKNNEQKIVYNAKAYVKKVTNIEGGHCSSVFVSYKGKTRHITNAHCCTAPMLYEDKPVAFLKVDTVNDLCELGHDNISKRGINISSRIPETTDVVYTVGFPGPYELTIGHGRIVSGLWSSPLNNQLLYRTSSFTIGGSSGGGAFDENGDLMGIVSQANGLAHGSFIPMVAVREFLN
jgi:hypothetical protein